MLTDYPFTNVLAGFEKNLFQLEIAGFFSYHSAITSKLDKHSHMCM